MNDIQTIIALQARVTALEHKLEITRKNAATPLPTPVTPLRPPITTPDPPIFSISSSSIPSTNFEDWIIAMRLKISRDYNTNTNPDANRTANPEAQNKSSILYLD